MILNYLSVTSARELFPTCVLMHHAHSADRYTGHFTQSQVCQALAHAHFSQVRTHNRHLHTHTHVDNYNTHTHAHM